MKSLFNEFEIQFDEKPTGVVLRINNEKGCLLRICKIPKDLIFDSNNEIKEQIDFEYPQTPKDE